MALKLGWNEIIPNTDYQRELNHCALRVVRSSEEQKSWVIEITERLMIRDMREIIEASTPQVAMAKAEAIAKARFIALEYFYTKCSAEVKDADLKLIL